MDDILVSVIIPVYNVPEQYLRKCVNSVIRQSFYELEIIIVNDGAGEEIKSLLENITLSDIRIKVINSNHSGVSVARNMGISFSRGRYIMFLDADDWLEEKAIEFAVQHILEENYELISWNCYYNSKKESKYAPIVPSIVVFRKENLNDLMYEMITPRYSERYKKVSLGPVRGVWGKLYIGEIIRKYNIKFDEKLKIGEDACFNVEYLNKVSSACFINSYLNHYRVDNCSANRRYREDIIELRIALLSKYRTIFIKFGLADNTKFDTCYEMEILSCVVNCLRKYICNKQNKMSLMHKLKILNTLLETNEVKAINTLRADKNFFKIYEQVLIWSIKKRRAILLYLIGKLL